MMAPYPRASLLGLPGELRNKIYEYVAADVTDIHVSAKTEVPFILGSNERAVDETSEWYTVATVTDDAASVYTQRPRPNADVFRAPTEKPAPKTTMAQHPLLRTCSQLRLEFVSILQSPATRPIRIEATVKDLDFSPLLRQLIHYSAEAKTALKDPFRKTCAINVHLKKGKASSAKVLRNLNVLRQSITLKKRGRLRHQEDLSFNHNGIQYNIHFETDLEWHTEEDYIKDVKQCFAIPDMLSQARTLPTADFQTWLIKRGIRDHINAHCRAMRDLLAEFAPADPKSRDIIGPSPTFERSAEEDWQESVLKKLLRGAEEKQKKPKRKPKRKSVRR